MSSEHVVAVDGVQYTVDGYGLAARLLADGALAQFVTQKGRRGIEQELGSSETSDGLAEFYRRCGQLPEQWAFQLQPVVWKSASCSDALTKAFHHAYPSGLVHKNAHLEEWGYFDSAGALLMLRQSQQTSRPSRGRSPNTSQEEFFLANSAIFALLLGVLQPNAKSVDAVLSEIDDDGALESRPLDVSDKAQVRSCIRDLGIDLEDRSTCARLGLMPFSDITLDMLMKASEAAPDF